MKDKHNYLVDIMLLKSKIVNDFLSHDMFGEAEGYNETKVLVQCELAEDRLVTSIQKNDCGTLDITIKEILDSGKILEYNMPMTMLSVDEMARLHHDIFIG